MVAMTLIFSSQYSIKPKSKNLSLFLSLAETLKHYAVVSVT